MGKSKELPHVFVMVDTREDTTKSELLIDSLKGSDAYTLHSGYGSLDVGDLAFWFGEAFESDKKADLVIELKWSYSDFWNSLVGSKTEAGRHHRLKKQIIGMCTQYDKRGLIIMDEDNEIKYIYGNKTGIHLDTLNFKYCLPVRVVKSFSEMTYIIDHIVRVFLKSDQYFSYPLFDPPPDASMVYAAVLAIDGAGPHTAQSVEHAYPTIEKLLTAGPKDLQKIPYVGKKIASRIFNGLRM